jgi:hypothetical protein
MTHPHRTHPDSHTSTHSDPHTKTHVDRHTTDTHSAPHTDNHSKPHAHHTPHVDSAHEVFVNKEDGSMEAFDQDKLRVSLVRAGAEPHQAQKIIDQVIEQVHTESRHEGQGVFCNVSDIYARAFSILKRAARAVAARYSLRRSLLQFGPTGFPFEEYVAELFKAKYNYDTLTGQIVLGGCVPHEVDVVGWNNETLMMAEVKYHSDAASKTDLKVALYVRARYDDLSTTLFDYGGIKRHISEGWLITNTRLTETAITYGTCKGLRILSWDYPKVGNLQDLIEETKLHPITCLTTLSESEKRELLKKNVVLAKSVYEQQQVLMDIGLSAEKIDELYAEVGEILKTVPR